jgi:hypothetical protein
MSHLWTEETDPVLQWLRDPWQVISHDIINTLRDSLMKTDIRIQVVKKKDLRSLSVMHKTQEGSLFPSSCKELGTVHSDLTHFYYFI